MSALGDVDVWVTNLTTGSMTPITANPAAFDGNSVVSGTRVAFERRDNGSSHSDIVVYDVATGVETVIASSTADERRPDIDGNIVGYDSVTASGDLDVHVHNLLSGVTTQIVLPADQRLPHISGDVVVFDTAGATSGPDVTLYHIPSGTLHPVATNSGVDFLNDISVSRVSRGGRVGQVGQVGRVKPIRPNLPDPPDPPDRRALLPQSRSGVH